jgi:hypothetical protein
VVPGGTSCSTDEPGSFITLRPKPGRNGGVGRSRYRGSIRDSSGPPCIAELWRYHFFTEMLSLSPGRHRLPQSLFTVGRVPRFAFQNNDTSFGDLCDSTVQNANQQCNQCGRALALAPLLSTRLTLYDEFRALDNDSSSVVEGRHHVLQLLWPNGIFG